MTDLKALAEAEVVRFRIEVLRSRDLEIPEFHALQLPTADMLTALLAKIEAQQEEIGRLRGDLKLYTDAGKEAQS